MESVPLPVYRGFEAGAGVQVVDDREEGNGADGQGSVVLGALAKVVIGVRVMVEGQGAFVFSMV